MQIRHLDLYLTLAIKNQIYDYIKGRINYRKYREYRIFQEIQQQVNGDDVVNFGELTQAVEGALSRLPEKSAEIFRRSRFENQSNREIAESLLGYRVASAIRSNSSCLTGAPERLLFQAQHFLGCQFL